MLRLLLALVFTVFLVIGAFLWWVSTPDPAPVEEFALVPIEEFPEMAQQGATEPPVVEPVVAEVADSPGTASPNTVPSETVSEQNVKMPTAPIANKAVKTAPQLRDAGNSALPQTKPIANNLHHAPPAPAPVPSANTASRQLPPTSTVAERLARPTTQGQQAPTQELQGQKVQAQQVPARAVPLFSRGHEIFGLRDASGRTPQFRVLDDTMSERALAVALIAALNAQPSINPKIPIRKYLDVRLEQFTLRQVKGQPDTLAVGFRIFGHYFELIKPASRQQFLAGQTIRLQFPNELRDISIFQIKSGGELNFRLDTSRNMVLIEKARARMDFDSRFAGDGSETVQFSAIGIRNPL